MPTEDQEVTEMKTSTLKERICPVCGNSYRRPPALSRKDNATLICPDCGTREALSYIGVSLEEQDEIIENIHKYDAGM